MALHRDIFWVGRQWAVTGYGIQAVDQRLRGVLDIEVARLWDDDLVASRRAKPGLNAEDFDKALTTARARWPRAPEPGTSRKRPAAKIPAEPSDGVAPPSASNAQPVQLPMEWRIQGRLARFLPQWRVRR
ncbi:hypothetical protein [Bradyrhizobium sp.]|uniref:hypothetical protein n=1 Tax=Bradyrhizobium sp. TaxID=376 RepID=UPI00238C4675|nr:hypothetical protein [Bradyrhizobium sp.]MDE2378353.1 hypothetical protein [Bradyrhizobium sp.]